MEEPLPLYRTYSSWLREHFGRKVYKIGIHAGFTCPNRDGTLGKEGCLFCNNAAFGPSGTEALLAISEQVRSGQDRLRRNKKADQFLAYFQTYTNTYAAPEILRQRYTEALVDDTVVGIAIGTRPDCLSGETLEVISEFARRTYVALEIGIPSANNKTLARMGRGHTYEDFVEAVRRLQPLGVDICAHVILGLPGESPEDMRHTALRLSELDLQGVKIHGLHIIRNTPLEQEYRQRKLALLSREDSIACTCDFLERLRPELVIHRLAADTPPDLCIAPNWPGGKHALIRDIDAELRRRGTKQGAKCAAELPGEAQGPFPFIKSIK